MAGPGGREVGRVSVRAVPNTDGFGAKLKRFLDKVEKAAVVEVTLDIDDKALRRLPRQVPTLRPAVEPDTSRAEKALANLGRKLNSLVGELDLELDDANVLADLEALVTKIETEDPELDLKAETGKALADVEKFLAQVRDADAEVEVNADTAKALGEIDKLVAKAKNTAAKVDLGADPTKAQAELDKFLAQAKNADAKVGIGAETEKAMAELRILLAKINASDASVKVHVKTDEDGGALGNGGGKGGVFGALTAGLGLIPQLASGAGSALGSLGGIAVSAASSLVTLALAASQVLVIAGGATFAVGALGAAVGLVPPALFALGGAGAAVALGLDGIKQAATVLKAPLDELRASTSKVFAAELAPLMNDIATRLLPSLQVGFSIAAAAVSNFATQLLAPVFGPGNGIELLGVALANVRVFTDQAVGGFAALIGVMVEIGGKTSLFTTLGQIVSYVALMFATLLARLAEGPPGMSLMEQAARTLQQVIESLGGLFIELVTSATEFFTGAGPGVSAAFDGIRDAISKIDFRALGESFGQFARIIGDFIASIPPETWQQMAQGVQGAVEAFGRLAGNPAVQLFFQGLIVAIPQVIGFLIDLLNAAISMSVGLVAAFLDVAAAGASVLESFGLLAPGTAQNLENMVGVMRDKVPDVAGAGDDLGKAAVIAHGTAIATMPGDAKSATDRAIDGVKGGRGNMLGAGAQLGGGAADGTKTGIAPLPGHVGGAVVDGRNRAAGEEGGYRGVGVNLASGLAVGVSSGQSGLIAAAIGIANAAWQAAKNFLGIASPSKLFRYQIGARIVQGWILGLKDEQGGLESAMTRLTANVAGIAQDADMGAAGQALGTQLGAGAKKGLAKVSPELQSAARELLARVNSGGQLFEDLSFRGMSGNLGKYNDQLSIMLEQSGKDLRSFLADIVNQQSTAYGAGQNIGAQIGAGMSAGVAASASAVAAEVARAASQVKSSSEYSADPGKAAYIASKWDGGSGSGARALTVEDLAALTWSVELDPEGVARINAKGERSLGRR